MSIISDGSTLRHGRRPDFSVFSTARGGGTLERQRVLNAACALQGVRTRLAQTVAEGRRADIRVLGPGGPRINESLYEEVDGWHELLSVRPWATVEELRVSLPTNRSLLERGACMTSVFDLAGATVGARLLLAGERTGDYHLGVAPVQMKIVNHREVLLDGPPVDGLPTVMVVSDEACLAAARAYWRAVMGSVVRCRTACADLPGLTDRQRQVVALLSAEFSDVQVAEALGCSVRTVRSDIAALMVTMGVRTRFALGRVVAEQVTGPAVEVPEAREVPRS